MRPTIFAVFVTGFLGLCSGVTLEVTQVGPVFPPRKDNCAIKYMPESQMNDHVRYVRVGEVLVDKPRATKPKFRKKDKKKVTTRACRLGGDVATSKILKSNASSDGTKSVLKFDVWKAVDGEKNP